MAKKKKKPSTALVIPQSSRKQTTGSPLFVSLRGPHQPALSSELIETDFMKSVRDSHREKRAASAETERKYLVSQATYRAQQEEEKREARKQLLAYSTLLAAGAEERRAHRVLARLRE